MKNNEGNTQNRKDLLQKGQSDKDVTGITEEIQKASVRNTLIKRFNF